MEKFKAILNVLERWKNCGEIQLSNETRMIGHLAEQGRLAYLHTIFSPLGEAGIATIENRIGTSLPEQYRQFLRLSNGLHLFRVLTLDGLRGNYARAGDESIQPFDLDTANTHERPQDAEDDWIFIGGYGRDGSTLYIDKTHGNVYRCENGKATHRLTVWPDFWSMLTSETERLASLFDDKGELIDKLASVTPQNNVEKGD